MHNTLFFMFKTSFVTHNSCFFSGPPECAPDLSDPMSVATYAAEEISGAKDGIVRYFSDEEGMKSRSCSKITHTFRKRTF